MGFLDRISALLTPSQLKPSERAAINDVLTSERGTRYVGDPIQRLYQIFYVSTEYTQTLADINRMDKVDGRVKQLHNKIARDATRGGFNLVFQKGGEDPRVKALADNFIRRCGLTSREKLKSDARGLIKDGNLFFQWVVDAKLQVTGAIKMPAASIRPNVDQLGRFRDPSQAYIQIDTFTGLLVTGFARWQITHVGMDKNPDDPGDLGRPLMDGARVKNRQLNMTEEDLVIRRRMRAPQRLFHVLEGASKEDITEYKASNKDSLENPLEVTSDFFSNKKGSVTAIGGDASVDKIEDVSELKADFFVSSGVPKELAGYLGKITRDVYDDAMAEYYELLEDVQEILADAYEEGFRLQMLLAGMDPDGYRFDFKFMGRKVESPNQLADRMLKRQALGVPPPMIWAEMGDDPEKVMEERDKWAAKKDPYQERLDQELGDVKIVQGGMRKEESSIRMPNKTAPSSPDVGMGGVSE